MPMTRPTFLLHSLVAASLAVVAVDCAAQDNRQRIDTTFAFERTGTVRLGIIAGEIRVVGHDANTIVIHASTERGRLESAFSRSRVALEVNSTRGRAGEALFELTVPVGTRVTASSVSGDIDIRATAAAVSANSVSGDVTVRDAVDRVEVGSVSGDIDIAKAKGRIVIESVSGEILTDDLQGELEVETVSGTIELRRSVLTSIRAETVSGDVGYDGPFTAGRSYSFNSHSGDVQIGLPANASAELELETFSGRIASDFPLTLQPGETGGRHDRRMEFTLGSGGARISAETFSGNITIRRLTARGNEE